MAIPFAAALWREAAGETATEFDLRLLRRSAVEVCPLADQADRVDISLEGDDFVLFIEVKVDANLQPDQLGRYAEAARRSASLRSKLRHAVIYLAPSLTLLPDTCVWIDWRRTAGALMAASDAVPNAYDRQSAIQFAEYITRFEKA
ncbi:PD-(D/E)XK nuclease family protein [Brevundimonas nasdae]|uniref:PD-(D/E)XK nuclease family protein n=2 Tax=Brevundimonas nasdae TaxID=172043 RepID=A0ABX8TJX8_9CAUL|nr:PD-(D/E)XK nuclease family protein [Brevundimonas nasdae]QYC11511.1 PD-(D/E)XK nuclease family protein [Brevundimonas nasdae]QYC14299.1 PD-(D/E)XK nuclease family protein [Brevundimonas nasdae]